MAATRRVLITGSRAWPWPALVDRALDAERARLTSGDTLIVIHGACPRGADAAAAAWCARVTTSPGATVAEQPHPARWRDQIGRLDCGAGMTRNAHMIAAGPDVVIAFWLDRSPGTADTLRRADTARIPALVHLAYTSPAQPDSSQLAPTTTARTTWTGRAAGDDRDADAEREMNQGYDPARNPVCGTCHVQTSNTGQCSCT